VAPLPFLQPVCSCLDCQQVLSALANNAKTNQHGHVDEHGILCHRLVELCPVGALALLFYIQFHMLLSHPLPGFAPTFGQPNYGEFGYRPWYENFVFWGEDPTKQMSYDSEFPDASHHLAC
jgi:hypothetical protein